MLARLIAKVGVKFGRTVRGVSPVDGNEQNEFRSVKWTQNEEEGNTRRTAKKRRSDAVESGVGYLVEWRFGTRTLQLVEGWTTGDNTDIRTVHLMSNVAQRDFVGLKC